MRPQHSDQRRALGALLVGWTLAAGVAASAALIPALAIAHVANAATDSWDAIDVDLADLDAPLPARTVVLAADDSQIAVLYNENRLPVAGLDQIAPVLVDAVLATEDDDFYTHGPIDLRGTARALARNTASGGTVQQGGSTITQQYVKLLRANAGQAEADAGTMERKLLELKYATKLEKVATKDDILLGYLNAAYFGNGAYGVGAAAQAYFSVPASELTLPQAAVLAGLLKNPTGYDPTLDPEAATDRRATVIARMVASGRITTLERDEAVAAPLGLAPAALPNGCTVSAYPYYCDWVRSTLLSDPTFGETASEREANLARGGFTVRTGLDPGAQATAQAAVDAAFSHDQTQAAAIAVVDPGSGAVPAIAASRDYATTQFNIPVQAALQPGSTFKVITLAAALEAGFATTTAMDAPARYAPAAMNAPAGGFRNDDGAARRGLTAATALKFSVNTWFVKLEEQSGLTQVADMAFRLGMTSMDPLTRTVGPADASLTLGAFETSPLQLANVYATLAADGVACTPVAITSVSATLDGAAMPTPDPACHQAISPAVARAVTAALSQTDEPGGTAAGLDLPGRQWVGKTGTTNDNGATWFAGYTPDLAASVWVGDTRGPTFELRNVTAFGRVHRGVLFGATVAGPIWVNAMSALLAAVPVATFPEPTPVTTWGTQVPDVVGLAVPAALSILADAGMDPVLPAGASSTSTVAAQSPASGSTVLGPVTLTLSQSVPQQSSPPARSNRDVNG